VANTNWFVACLIPAEQNTEQNIQEQSDWGSIEWGYYKAVWCGLHVKINIVAPHSDRQISHHVSCCLQMAAVV